jgi:molybdopterin molybdotransferase
VPRSLPALTPAQALARILALARRLGPLDAERVALADACGRVLSAPLLAQTPLPPFAASTMDGYACRAADLPRRGGRLPLAGTVAAGHPWRGRLRPGTCLQIFTGAPLPAGADAVEMQEQVEVRDGQARFARAAQAGRFVRAAGSDLRRGAVALPAGTRLDPGAIGLAAALGLRQVPVRRRPVVAILSTGDEVVPLGRRPGPGQIVESNAQALAAAVREAGGRPRLLGIARDHPSALRRAIARARTADVLLTIGGVSVGERDLVRGALVGAGAEVDFWRVAMRPGKPLLFGRLGRTLLFGLPGNPASALVGFELFARPALRALTGLSGSGRASARARLDAPQVKPPGLAVYLRARLEWRRGEPWIVAHRTQMSGDLTSTAAVGALALLPAGRARLARGTRVEAILLDPAGPP